MQSRGIVGTVLKAGFWVGVAYFGMRGCTDATCLEGQTLQNQAYQNDVQGIRDMGGALNQGPGLYQRAERCVAQAPFER